jgi:hypothetical protein|tara:strand:- start:495 stop:833 length:339 start_codon:yes stop_codon:yes gene_type:complete
MPLKNRPPTSFFIEIQPKMTDESTWAGELEVNIITSHDNPMKEDSKAHMLHLCQLVASTVALMEKRPALVDELEDFLEEEEEYYVKNASTKKVTTEVEGNVIKLNFGKGTRH